MVPKITYIEANGAEHVVEVEAGLSVMRGARDHDIPGILAECGGHCACGTCQVYIDEAWRSKTGIATEIEEGTLEIREDPLPGRRLSCQIKVTQELDGLVVRLPERQF